MRQSILVDSLLRVVAELMAVPLLIAAALLFEVLGVGLIGVGQLATLRRDRQVTRLLRWWRRFVWTLTGVLGLVLASLVFVDLFLFEPGLRVLLEQVERSSGVDLGFTRARGSLFTGAVELEGVTVRHAGGADIDLTIAHLAIDVDMLRGFVGAAVPVTELRMRGVRGDIARRSPGGGLPGRAFTIERVVVEDLQLGFEDLAGAPLRVLPIAVDHLEIAPLRSEYPLVDLVCHSRARGRARGYRVTAEPGSWQVRDIPLSPQGGGKLGAAGRWFRGGAVDLDLTCPDDQADPLVLRIDMALHGFQVAPPGDTGRRLVAAKIASALGRLGPRVELDFSLEIGRERLRGVATAAELDLWDRAVQAWSLKLGEQLRLSRDELLVLGIGSRAVEKLRQGRPRREAVPARTH